MRNKINDQARLELILEAIDNIESFLADTESEDAFVADKILCHAVAYNVQHIGECSYMLSREFVTVNPEIDWEAIEGLRHILVHDYYRVRFQTIWRVYTDDIPVLKQWILDYLSCTK